MTFALLLVCFFLSGFSALLYETAWTREFAFVFGTSELAVVAVLAAYMGGLALGAALAARWAPRVRRPVLAYGVLELAIALWALAVPSLVGGLRGLYLGWLGGLDALPESLGLATHAFHLLGAFVVLVPCTALMGATLPLLARFAVQRDDQIGPRVGVLYATNTAGAIAGTLTAAFVLLPAIGLRQTVWVGAIVNVGVFAAAALLARFAGTALASSAPRSTGVPWILPAILLSGAVSFAYEVLWFRLLAQVVGTSTAAFSTMLASFLLGIALGSAAAARWARERNAAAKGFALAQIATAATAWATFLAADHLPALATALGASRENLGAGAGVGIAVLLPVTLCIGATFPFAVRLLAPDAAAASASSARVYAWNTVGSIFGAVGTGYVLLPVLGFVGTVLCGIGLNLALATFVATKEIPGRRIALVAGGLVAFVGIAATTSRPEQLLRASPIAEPYRGPIHFFAVGRSATVALFELGVRYRLATNGLPESMITPPDYPISNFTARWLSMLPVMLRPELRDMLIVGLGGGVTLQSVPATVESIDVIELEPEVVAANRSVPVREGGDPLADPRVRLRLGDARGALILSDRRYDAIVSQPSHPWTSGASHLYTREFFQLAADRLTPDGVFVQWIGDHFIDEPRLQSLLAALNEAFEHVALYRPPHWSNVMIASQRPFDPVATIPRALAAAPDDFDVAGLHRLEDVITGLVLDAEGTRAFAGNAPPSTDDFNRLASGGDGQLSIESLDARLAKLDPLEPLIDELDAAQLALRFAEIGHHQRAERIATGLPYPRRELTQGWIALENGRLEDAKIYLRAAYEARPDWDAAAAGLALADPRQPLDAFDERIRAVALARRSAARGRFEPLRELDDALATWKPGELLFRDAAELRVIWRLQLGIDDGLAEATAQLEKQLRRRTRPQQLLLVTRGLAASGQTDSAWMHLDRFTRPLANRATPRMLAMTRRLVASLPPAPDPRIRSGVMRAIEHAERRHQRQATGAPADDPVETEYVE